MTLSLSSSRYALARNDGAEPLLWEPLWGVEVALSPLEQRLLRSAPLRRLHFLNHNGSSCISTAHTYSRLQHTLGVFALLAQVAPDDAEMRAAALLHDVGHAPFSHTLDGLPGVDHHRWTRERIAQEPLAGLLADHGLDAARLCALIEGEPTSPLRNADDALHADHLDSWVRGAQARGVLPLPAPELRTRLRRQGDYLETDLATAEVLVELIVVEAHFHASVTNLGTGTVLSEMVGTLLAAGELTAAELSAMTDGELEGRLFASPRTRPTAQRLYGEPYRLRLEPDVGQPPPQGALRARKERLYLSMPRVGGRPVTEVSARARALLAEAERLRGDYLVSWLVD